MACKQDLHVEIPGYYYDERRRRYFRRSSMQQISNLEPPVSSETSSGTPSICPEKMNQPASFYDFVMRRQYDSKLSTSHLYEYIACSLKKKRDLWAYHSETAEFYDNIAFNHLGNVFAVKSTTPSHTHEYGVTVVTDRDDRLHQKQIFNNKIFNKVEGTSRSLDFLPPAEDGTESLLILRSAREVILSKIRLGTQSLGYPETSYSSNCVKVKGFVCTAMWNRTPHTQELSSFVIGCDDGSIQLRNIHRKLVCLRGSWKSPVVSLGCDHQSPLLYAGYRNGCINIWDLRAKPRCIWNAKEPADGKVASSIIGLHPLTDGNYFVSNAFNSNLSLWDIRMKFKTLSFRGHINTFKHCKSIVDKAETFVAVAGSDLCVRLWSLRTGEMLQTIDHADYSETEEKSFHTPPVISYTDTFGGRHANPVLLIAYDGTQTTFSINGYPFMKECIYY